jgi:HEAT repeats
MAKIRLPHLAADALPDRGDPRPVADDHERLRAFALGLESNDVRARAIIALAGADPAGRVPVLNTLLQDPKTPPRLRHLAATLLGRIESHGARDALLNALGVPDPRLVGQVAQSLGRIGDRTVVAPLMKAAAGLHGLPRGQAQFALRLLAHRLDLDFPDEPLDDVSLLPRPGDEAQHIRAMRADPIEAQVAARAMTREPFGIELNEQSAQQFVCDDVWSVLLFDRALGAPPLHTNLLSRKRLAAVVGRKAGDDGLYSPSLLLLTSPGRSADRILLALYQPNGTLTMTGSAIPRPDGLAFELRTVVRAGAVAVWIEGMLAGDAVALEVGRTECSRRSVGHPVRRLDGGSGQVDPA